jgi:hypothetical protein
MTVILMQIFYSLLIKLFNKILKGIIISNKLITKSTKTKNIGIDNWQIHYYHNPHMVHKVCEQGKGRIEVTGTTKWLQTKATEEGQNSD